MTPRRSFVFDTDGTPAFALPVELSGFPFPADASMYASDHRPVVVDLKLPLIHDADGDGDVDLDDWAAFQGCLADERGGLTIACAVHDADRDGDIDLIDYGTFMVRFSGP